MKKAIRSMYNTLERLKELYDLAVEAGMSESDWFLGIANRLSVQWNGLLYEKTRETLVNMNLQPLLHNAFPIPKNNAEIAAINAEYKFGKIAYTDIDFGISRLHLNRHGLIIGDTGTGKSTLAKILASQLISNGGIAVWIIDPKETGDFRFLAKQFQDVIILRPSVLRLNPFSAIANCSTEYLREAVSDVTADVYKLFEASESIILKNISKILKECEQPTFYDFVDSFYKETAKSGGRRQGYLDSISSRIDKTIISLGNIINCKKDYLSEIYDKNVVFELGMLSGFSQKIAIVWIILSLMLYRTRNPTRHLTNLVIFDESQAQIFAKQENPGRTPTMATIITQARAHGIGIIALAQNCRKLMDELISNSAFKSTFHLGSGEEIWAMSRHLGLNPQQVEEFYHLNTQEAICRLSFGYMEPVLLNIYDFKDDYVSNDELDEIMQPKWDQLLEGIEPANVGPQQQGLPLQPKKDKASDDLRPNLAKPAEAQVHRESIKSERDRGSNLAPSLSEDEKTYLTTVKRYPYRLTLEIYSILSDKSALGTERISQSKAVDLRKKLLKSGYLETLTINGTGKSGRSSCDILTEKAGMGMPPRFRGNYVHSFYIYRISTYFDKQGATTKMGDTASQNEIDVSVELDKQRIGVEIVISTLVFDNLPKHLKYYDSILIFCIDDAKMDEVMGRVKSLPEDIQQRITIKLLKDYFISL